MKTEIQGVLINNENLEKVTQRVEGFIKDGQGHFIVTANPEIVMLSKNDAEFRQILQKADIVTADGIGLIIAAKIMGKSVPQRVTGIDLINKLFKLSQEKGYRIFFLGAKEGIAEKAKIEVEKTFPGVQIVGHQHGFFTDHEKILENINDTKPDILLVALGMGRQEKWIWNNLEGLNCSVSIGVGGSFDILSGELQRAPKWMQKYGIEWLYRLIQEPSRFMRMMVLPKFLLIVLGQRLRKLFGGSHA